MDALTILLSLGALALVAYLVRSFSSSPQPIASKTSEKKDVAQVKEKMKEETKEVRYITKEEVAKHNSRDDVWLIIDDKVYDVTKYVDEHLGGDAILNYAGGDSSIGFHGDQHPVKVKEVLWEFYIGDLKK
eukprot:TRINITY_DN4364_c0_g1_i1.p1 TRINITY_DN4364_c0_g1~~TRINITY_DN4364_c0_g1_i1.p1  ORF type:complete len:138 (+),score=32.09 TRINITY_DN4364_c0_g1_i1:22-414(+)